MSANKKLARENRMNLKDFVRDALLDVITGVHEAAESVRTRHGGGQDALRGAVNPKSAGATNEVEFDLAVTVSRTGEGSGSVRVLVFGAEGKILKKTESLNRIKFAVPVAFASQPVGEEHTTTGAPGGPEKG